ncbi:hypothetical protein SteCoe_31559 [Stentor coeruleus]|uniref:Receptor ligand binding region domain-containing protein n=1 Tax=Stentor coeruleus TaxID=5963 RepID=A0A1R2B0Z2_9CILI|nr:hypothetical protein SteCoe_31559 [Stentor coeruleus]
MSGLAFLIQLYCVFGFGIEDGAIFISNKTPNQIKTLFSNASSIIDVSSVSVNEIFSSFELHACIFIVDVTWTKSYLGLINSLSETFEVAYFTLSTESTKFMARYPLHNTKKCEAQSLSSLITFLAVEEYVLLSSTVHEDLSVADYLIDIMQEKIHSHITYPEGVQQVIADNIIGKMIKSKGIKALVIIDSTDALKTIEKAMESKKYITPGTIIIYSSRSFSQNHTSGTFKIEEYMSEKAKNQYEFDYFALINRLSKAQEYIEIELGSSVNKNNFIQALSKIYQSNILYSIINIQNNIEIPIGLIYQNSTNETIENNDFITNITETIYFPGNITHITSMKTKLVFSIANGTNEPYHAFQFPILSFVYEGANYAALRSNAKNEIPNFYIELFPTDCGISWYDPYWYKSCFEPLIDNLGIAMLTSFFADAIKGNLLTLRELSKVIPQVSPIGGSLILDNKEKYPELVKLETKADIYYTSRFMALKNLGYTDLLFLVPNETEQQRSDSKFIKYLIKSSGMRIINDDDHMFIPYNYTRLDFEKYYELFKYLKDTRCTVVFFLAYDLGMVIEAFYDAGFRKGGFIYVTDSGALHILDGIEEPYASKRKEIVEGSLILSYREYVGDYGKEIQKELLEMYSEITYMCMTFDTVSVVKEAIIYLLSTGDDYEDYNKLMSAIRKNKFTGCLGNVYFSIDGNSRASSQFLIQQIYYNLTIQTFESIDISYLDRFSSQLITIINPYVWPTGSPPPNYIPYSPCPFDSYEVHSSSKGIMVLCVISSLLFVICLVSCVFTLFKTKNEINLISSKKYISFDDYMFFLYFPLQFFQIIAMGPDQLAYKKFIKNFQVFFSLDFNLYFYIEFERFWHLFYSVFGFTIYWIFGCILLMLRLDVSLERFSITRELMDIYKIIIPSFGHLGFLPIVSMLMNIFVCIEGISDEITDSFLKQDCTVMCYNHNHKAIASITSIILLVFIPLTVYNRPLWEQTKISLHIQTKSKYLILLSLCQISFAILNKTLKFYDQLYHGIACSLITFGLLIFTILYRPYNYTRATISQCISLTAALWALVVATSFRNGSSLDIWIIVEIIGLIFVLICGTAIFYKFPQFLISEKGLEISKLFLFQFFKKYEDYAKYHRSLNNMTEEKYKTDEIPESEY